MTEFSLDRRLSGVDDPDDLVSAMFNCLATGPSVYQPSAFLLPHQAEMLPEGLFDLCINISSLHEMKRDQIQAYFQMIDRLTSGYFYTKQWKVSLNPVDKLTILETEYPVPQRWQTVYHRTPPVQRRFFEAMYKIG